MTDNEKARIVAEWCGWCPGKVEHIEAKHWINDVWRCNSCGKKRSYSGLCDPRTRLRTLNACAEFERMVKERELESEYERALIAVCGQAIGILGHKARTFDIATATPAQRVDAILQVIGGDTR